MIRHLLSTVCLLLFTAPLTAPAEIDPSFMVKPGTKVAPALQKIIMEASGGSAPPAAVVQFVSCESKRCGESLVALDQTVARPLEERGLVTLGIAVEDTQESAQTLATEKELSFTLFADPNSDLFNTVAKEGVPRTLVIDNEMKVVYQYAGWRPGREAEFLVVAKSVLDGGPLPEGVAADNTAALQTNSGDVSAMLGAVDFRGKQAPEVPVEEWINEPHGVADGKYVLVDFWATWCGPCIQTLDEAEKLHSDFDDKLFAKAVSDEDAQRVSAFVDKRGWEQPIGVDTQRRGINVVKPRGIPHGFLANPEGEVIWQGHPMELWMNDAAKLKELLK